MFTRLGIGGVGKTYGTITAKSETTPDISRPSDIFTRIAVGGLGQIYAVTDKSETTPITDRPGDILTRIGIGGIGAYYEITAKQETEIIEELTAGYYGTGLKRKRNKEEDEMIAIIMAMYETNTLH